VSPAPRIGYGLGESGRDLQHQTWEIRDRAAPSAVAYLMGRVSSSLVEGLRMELAHDHVRVGGRDLHYYTPLDALRPGHYGAAFHRRMATLLWRCLAERCVELPRAKAFLDERPWTDLLEVGHVLDYWYPLRPHVVVDRYERGRGVVNEDIVDFRPGRRFDTIVSISTLEHVGFDEPAPDPGKFLRAVRALETLRASDGRFFLTVPIGYNPSVDRAIRDGEFWAYETEAVVGDPDGRRGYRQVPVAEALQAGEGILFATLGGA
jgi:hypothetical protein